MPRLPLVWIIPYRYRPWQYPALSETARCAAVNGKRRARAASRFHLVLRMGEGRTIKGEERAQASVKEYERLACGQSRLWTLEKHRLDVRAALSHSFQPRL